MRDPILITGVARSGTSMTAGIIERCGAFGGKTVGPSPDNPKGFYENISIREQLQKPMLAAFGGDPLGQNPLPNLEGVKKTAHIIAPKLRNAVVAIMKGEGWDGESPWYVKTIKGALVWPIWDLAFPGAMWVIVRRDVESIISSCMRTSFMSAFDTRDEWRDWVGEYNARLEDIIMNVSFSIEYHPARAMNGVLHFTKNMILNLELDWDFNKVCDFIDPNIFH